MWHRIRAEQSFAFEKANKSGWRAAFQPKDATKGFDEIIEVMPELLRPFLAMAMTALGSRKTEVSEPIGTDHFYRQNFRTRLPSGATAASGRNVDDESAGASSHTKCEGCGTNPIFPDNSTRWRHWVIEIPTSSRALEMLSLVRGKRVPYK